MPKGSKVEAVARHDGQLENDGKFMFGPCQTNTARAHHIKSGLYEGCGVSTTRDEDMAVLFATKEKTVDGYVYVIDENLLANANVDPYEFDDPKCPNESEVTLIEQNGGAIPDLVIVEKYAVSADGSRN